MKTIFHVVALCGTLCLTPVALHAQSKSSCCNTPDSVLLTADLADGYLVKRYRVRQAVDPNTDYGIRYRIDASRLSTALSGNTQELHDLEAFVQRVRNDSTLHICGVTITGYASPDGNYAQNEQLAKRRATDLSNYLNGRCHLSARYPVHVTAVVDPWSEAVPMVESSAIPNKDDVLQILRSTEPATAKERMLKQLPTAWNYLCRHILPTLRQVEVSFCCDRTHIATCRIPITTPPTENPTVTVTYVLLEDPREGLLLDLTETTCCADAW